MIQEAEKRARRIPITRADYDAAADWYGEHAPLTMSYEIMAARFARHRTEALEEAAEAFEAIKEFLDRDEGLCAWSTANDALVAIRALSTPPTQDKPA